MFDYARKMQLFARETVRRASLKAGAGVAILIGSGFLLAALWVFLADNLDWGSLGASLAIGIVFVVAGLVVIATGGRKRYRAPTTDELRSEIQERVSLATEAVLDRVSDRTGQALDSAQQKAANVVDLAGNKLSSLVDSVTYKADRFAARAESKAYGFARRAGDQASEKLGLTDDHKERIADSFGRAKSSNLAAIAPVVGAFALGLSLATRIAGRGEEGDGYDDYPDYDEYSDYGYSDYDD